MWRFQNSFFPSWKCGDLVFFLTYFSKCGDFKTLFFPLLEMWRFSFFFLTYFSKCGDFKTLFFPLLEMRRISFFFGIFSKCSLHHVCFHGGLFNGFSSQKINKIKIKLAALRLCVCRS